MKNRALGLLEAVANPDFCSAKTLIDGWKDRASPGIVAIDRLAAK